MSTAPENTTLQIEGMTCTNCALSVTKSIEKKGAENVNVNFVTGEASFKAVGEKMLKEIVAEIEGIGYKVMEDEEDEHKGHNHDQHSTSTIEKKFYWSLVFTVPLFSHMFLPIGFLHNPIVQLALCIPVFVIGLLHFGKSAWGSVKTGIPNMDVLIFIGSTSAFIYSLLGTIYFYGAPEVHNYLFYETAATIITLVFLGNVLEHRSVKQTTTAIRELNQLQVSKTKRVIIHNGQELIEEVDYKEIKIGDVLQVNNGDKIAVDGMIISGNASIDEAMLSGESVPIDKSKSGKVVGGTVVVNGQFRMVAEAVGKETVLSKIIEMVKNAQQAKPNIQKLGDKVSAIFVPVVLLVSIATFLIAYFVFQVDPQKALMNSIAVLVVSCPCAMGLATPTAVMVGIGRAAKNGILIKGGNTLEEFAKIQNIVFDKTGTLTTGEFKVRKLEILNGANEDEIKNILFNLEQHSSHPIAKSIVAELKGKAAFKNFKAIKEEKGLGIEAKDEEGNNYKVGSYKTASHLTSDATHNIYVLKNNQLIATVDIEDSLKANTPETISWLKSQNITPIMLSGDNKKKCEELAKKINIEKVYSEQSPAQKIEIVDQLVKQSATAMVGDGINDAPALAKATVGISLSNATQVAIQSAQIILLKNDISKIIEARQISKHTLITIKQNLFWAFFYNVVAIPIAAMGFLNPMVGALSMAFSDVIVIGNSIRLKRKKLS